MMRGRYLLVTALVGCGPTQVRIDPASVVDVQVRPRSGQRLFCPGDPFQVEVVAKLQDGSRCSNVDDSLVCAGQQGQVIDAAMVQVRGGPGQLGGDFVFKPPADPLATAGSGISLEGWLEGAVGEGAASKSMVGEVVLRPVYQCQQEKRFAAAQSPNPGAPGAPGPDVQVSVTTLSTPFYSNAALVRIEVAGQRYYLVSPSVDQPVRIVSQGAPGMPGLMGESGVDGAAGTAAPADAASCTMGGAGGDGTDGGAGMNGGHGGDGGLVRVVLDEGAADALRGRVDVRSLPGQGGPGGAGGLGGSGGPGGMGGPADETCPSTLGPAGSDGRDGTPGATGQAGRAETPVFSTAPRDQLFAAELGQVRAIEAMPAASP